MYPFELKRRHGVTVRDVDAAWKHQVRLQIYLPFGAGLLVVGLLIGLLWLSGVGDASAWADVSIVLLFALVILLGIVGLVISVTAMVGVIYLIRLIPSPFDRTRSAASEARAAVSQASEAAIKPIIVPRAASYALIAGVRYLAGIFKG